MINADLYVNLECTGNLIEDKNELLLRFTKELQYAEKFYRQLHADKSSQQDATRTSDGSSTGEENEEEVSTPTAFYIPTQLRELSYVYLGLLLMCEITQTKEEQRFSRITNNADSNRSTKRRNWMNSILVRIIKGDQDLVDLCMVDLLRYFKYEQRASLQRWDHKSTFVGQFHLVQQSSSFSDTSSRLQMGGNVTKSLSSCFVYAKPPTPFMRIVFSTQTNASNVVECTPSHFENISMTQHTLNTVKYEVSLLQDSLLKIQRLYETLSRQTSFPKDKILQDKFTSLLLLEKHSDGTYMYSLEKFFYQWSPSFRCKDNFWKDFQQQPSLSEKLARYLHLFSLATAILVSTYLIVHLHIHIKHQSLFSFLYHISVILERALGQRPIGLRQKYVICR